MPSALPYIEEAVSQSESSKSKTRRLTMMMRRREGIGFGGLASEIGWLTRSRGDVVWLDEEELIEGLMDRFKAAREDAQYLIEIAVKCNMIEVENGKIRAKLQDNTPIG